MKRIRRDSVLSRQRGTIIPTGTDSMAKPCAPRFLLLAVLLIQRHHSGEALFPASSPRRGSYGWQTTSKTVISPLFVSSTRRLDLERRRQHSSSTALPMVLTTPESIIEQASTVNLLDDLIDESVRTSPRRPIMMQFDPSSGWIWRRWKGTIFSETWTSCVKNIVYASLIFLLYKKYPGVKDHLNGFGTLWGQLLSVTTFTLTFFVNQSYALWRKCYELSRRLQGRLHDIGMNLATHATRKVPTTPDETSTYTASSRQILELMSRYIRLFDLLTYASFTRSHRPILTPRGMRRLVERGLMTAQERQVLVDAAIPATQRHSAILMWMIRLFVEGRASGHIQGGDGFEQQTMEKFHIIRAQYGAIGDELQGRMPLAYAHVVQILVDLILWMYPIMAFSIGMSPLVAIAGTGLLTISYQGLFDLAKQFLDPYDNENYGKGEDPLSVDTLIAETNAGSVRWMYGFEEMPFSQDKVKDGELYDYLLPVRGYTVDELAQMEEEKLQREKEAEEQRIREAQEQLKREAQALALAEESQEQLSEDSAEINGDNKGGEYGDIAVDGTTDEVVDTPPVDEQPPVHKVFTLADGTVVSFKGEPEIVVEVPEARDSGKLIAPRPGVPTGADSYLASLSLEDSMNLETKAEIELDSEELLDLPFFEDLAQAGNMSPVTQIVADGEVKDNDVLTVSLGREKELEPEIADVENDETLEVVESRTILSSSPMYVAKEEQNSLISGREVSMTENEAVMSPSPLEDLHPPGQAPEALQVNIEAITADMMSAPQTKKNDENKEKKKKDKYSVDRAGQPGKELIKATDPSEVLEESKVPATRMTIEDYNKQVEAIMETAKEELLETEAILNARPGYDPVGWDYDHKWLVQSTDGPVKEEAVVGDSAEKNEEEDSEVLEEEDLAVLEMDMPNEEEAMDLSQDGKYQETILVTTDFSIDGDDVGDADDSEYRL